MDAFINSDNENKSFSNGRHHTSYQQPDVGAKWGNTLSVEGKIIACCRRQDEWLQLKHQPYIWCNSFGDLSWNCCGHGWPPCLCGTTLNIVCRLKREMVHSLSSFCCYCRLNFCMQQGCWTESWPYFFPVKIWISKLDLACVSSFMED